jgi:hypothetical protein
MGESFTSMLPRKKGDLPITKLQHLAFLWDYSGYQQAGPWKEAFSPVNWFPCRKIRIGYNVVV